MKMNYKLGVLALVALQACYSAALPPCVCARNLAEVCGSDGETYSNLCTLNCEIHKGKKDLTVASEGPCVPDAQPSCICTMDYKPVCGNDGKTYPNRCAMLCTRSKNPNIEMANEGQCADKVKVADNLPIPAPCTCTRENEPVCGSDGKTYSNLCTLNCEIHKGRKDLTLASEGPCVPDAQPSCICTMDYKPVCGNDGKTYPNRCAMLCTRSKNPNIEIANEGQCADKVKVADNLPIPAPCTCTRENEPVCGSDGKTYSNLCTLNCEIHKGINDLTLASEGPCVPDAQPSCICTMDYKPVCGNDGKTYPNRCAMLCTRSKNPNIEIANEGQCADKVKVADNLPIPPPCTCTREFEPVCGSDDKTYANDCLLNCATANDNTLKISHAGKCGCDGETNDNL